MRELFAAPFADFQHCAVASALEDDEHLIVGNVIPSIPAAIAAMTTRHKVAGIVVPAVVVEVVDREGASARAATDQPVDRVAAPVTGMRTKTDLLEQHHTVLRHRSQSVFRLERMVPQSDVAVSGHLAQLITRRIS